MELEFFGVMGSSFEDNNLNVGTSSEQNLSSSQNNQQLLSNYDLELKVLNDSQSLKKLPNIEIQSLMGLDLQISGSTLCKINPSDLKKLKLTARTTLSLTDSHFQLQDIPGLSLVLSNNQQDKNLFELRGVSIQGIVAEEDHSSLDQQHRPIFNQPHIPIQYMRSCLLSPRYFNIINKVLAKMTSDERYHIQLRLTIVQFLDKIMKIDREFARLIYEEVDLARFLLLNLFSGDSTGIQLTVEFLQNFQRDVNFCSQLYKLLISQIERLPDHFISYSGYEALIGLLIWSVPLNPEITIQTLLQTLYQKICLQKIPQLQTKEAIAFRTRYNINAYPFDLVSFKNHRQTHNAAIRKESIDQSQQFVSQVSSNKFILPVDYIKKVKADYVHSYEVAFKSDTKATDLKIFLANQDVVQYKMIVRIFDNEGSVVYFNTFDEQIFSQLACMAYQKLSQSNPQDDCLHITNLNYSSSSLRVMIEFGISNSSLPKGTKNKPPDSMIEIYGSSSDLTISQAKIKEQIDKKAQEYWQSGAKLIKVGKAMQMLQITKSVDEYLIVPQVSSISTLGVAKELQNTVLALNSETNLLQKSDTTQISTQLAVTQSATSNSQLNISHLAPNKQSELQVLQEELKGKIRVNDPNIKELVDKIQYILNNSLSSNDHQYQENTVQSLEFYMALTSDFTKIIRNLFKNKSISKDMLQTIIRELDPSGDLSQVCFELFKKYVVYDSGTVRQDIQEFITVCLNPMMQQSEIRAFSFKVIEDFLSSPHSGFSQKAVLEALTYLGIPEGELVSFLIQKLGINLDLKSLSQANTAVKQQNLDPKIQPFVFMSSVLMLILSQLKQIVIPMPGQLYHKGVKCSGCNAKMVLGWRYKCGHCVQDMNFDQKCMLKHIQEYPNHIMLIIRDPLPELSKSQLRLIKSSQSQILNKPILPYLKLKELAAPEEQKQGELPKPLIHDGQNCDNCAKKNIEGQLYKCVNCEEYNLCSECYTQKKGSHHTSHIFAEILKPLDTQDKNPTVLMQILDPRLYPQVFKIEEVESPSKIKKDHLVQQQPPSSGKPAGYEDGSSSESDDFEDLAPLSVSRSLSQPMPLKKIGQDKSKQHQQQIKITLPTDEYEKLDYDQQFIVMFHTCVWLSQDIKNAFSKQEKIVLLKLTIETMLNLIKLTNIAHIESVISNKDAFFQILISILQLNSKELIQLFKNLFDLIRQPPSAIWIPIWPGEVATLSVLKKQEIQDQQRAVMHLLEILVSHLQNFLKWMIDLALQPDLAKLHSQTSHHSWALLLKSYQNQKIWLDHLQLIVELFIKTNDEIKNHQAQKLQQASATGDQQPKNGLEKIPEDSNENEDDGAGDLVPLSMARSVSQPLKKQQSTQIVGSQGQSANISLQIIKNMVQLLYVGDNGSSLITMSNVSPQKGAKQATSHFTETESQTKYLSQMWSLVLKSLTSVNINQLIEARIFDALVNAFLISTEEIKQITFPQILAITETIAKQSINSNDISKFISNLLFLTLENVTGNHHEKVGYSVCQGWLDILITSNVARTGPYEQTKTVYAKFSNEELSTFLKKTSQYLMNFLNKGSFEGVTGSVPEVAMRLCIASDLMYVLVNAESKEQSGQKAISELFKSLDTNVKLRKDYSDSVNNMMAWLFMNARQAKDEIPISQLGNSSSLTPSTARVKQITENIEEMFQVLGDNGENSEEAVKIALECLTAIARKMNQSLIDLSETNSLGFELSVKLSERTNEYFIKLLGLWLVNDKVASYFVFDLNGFEFLLDTIGIGSQENEGNLKKLGQQTRLDFEIVEHIDTQIQQIQQNKAHSSSEDKLEMLGSDLVSYLESNFQDFSSSSSKDESKAAIPSTAEQQLLQQNLVTSIYENSKQLYVQEFSKNISMVDNNGLDPIQSFQKTDWSVNKRAYKHRVIVKQLTGHLRAEYWILFSLPHEVELREIQIAFNNYWSADTEFYAEPLSVLVEAGMDEKNLSLVCNLQIVKDDAFGGVSATVFGANLLTFQSNTDTIQGYIQDIIQSKLQSIQNFKIKYIKFCMRRSVITCLENSPLATKFTKQIAFGINYISLLGYDLTRVGNYVKYIKQEQKRTALEVLSIICSGDFKSILKVIAQQPKTIEKMKQSFNMLASLVSIKENLIEPTFIAISTYNNEMGDWIINQFLKSATLYKHASLIGQIIICNKNELPRRLRLLQDHVISSLRQIVSEGDRSSHSTQIKKLLPYIQIFIETLRIAAPDILTSTLNSKVVDLGIKESHLLDIVNLLSSSTAERELQTKVLIQLLVLLLSPPQPFVNTQIDIYEFTVKHLLESLSSGIESNETKTQKEILASILSVTRTSIALEILNRGLNLDKLLRPDTFSEKDQSQGSSHHILTHALKFWINVSQDEQVRQRLSENKFPLKLYENLRQINPEQNDKIIRKDNVFSEQELNLMIELIKQLITGSPLLEGELAQELMNDLEHLSKIRDMDFVNKVFLQLLRTEKTIPVCLWPYDSENAKWIPNYKPIHAQENSKVSQAQMSQLHNTFVPSQLLQGDKRSTFIKNFKEILGQHSKANVKKLLSSNWTLAHTQTEQGSVSQFQAFWKNIENKSPVVILISGTNATGQNVTFGCFSAKGIPAMPANLAQDSDYPVPSSPEDFVFCYIDDNSFHHFSPKPSVPIISMFTDYEGGGAISVANDFMLMSYSYDFVFTVGIVYDIEKILVESNPKPEKEVENSITFQKFEIWTTDLTKLAQTASSQVQPALIPPTLPKPTLSKVPQIGGGDQMDLNQSTIFSQSEVKHPWFNILNPYINYRSNPVFMVPSHLTLNQLSKIMLQSNVHFKTRLHQLQAGEQLNDIYQSMISEQSILEQHNGIIDLEYEINQLLGSSEEPKEEEQSDQDPSNSQLIQGYVPKMGLFEQFENKGGVKLIISVTLQSMKLWKSEEQSKSWELWLKELESFSEIPLFFQLFLKNSKCKDLLFKVLAGQPDQEINAKNKPDPAAQQKWEEEQKQAVQFNYKILSEAFQISDDLKLRDIGIKCGLLPTILERLGAISGEKPRILDEAVEEIKKEEKPIELSAEQLQMQQLERNVDKKKRKGVGYSSKVGQTFNVTQYLENKKLRNDQIKNLVDICSNFINCKEWNAGEEVCDIILESALLPLLEAAFRNGSWLDMAKEYEVYHSYLALTRAIASQKNLVKCLGEIDPNYKPSQSDPIYRLLSKLNDLAQIFINCLNQQQKSEQLKPKPLSPTTTKTSSNLMFSQLNSNLALQQLNNLPQINLNPLLEPLIQNQSSQLYQLPSLPAFSLGSYKNAQNNLKMQKQLKNNIQLQQYESEMEKYANQLSSINQMVDSSHNPPLNFLNSYQLPAQNSSTFNALNPFNPSTIINQASFDDLQKLYFQKELNFEEGGFSSLNFPSLSNQLHVASFKNPFKQTDNDIIDNLLQSSYHNKPSTPPDSSNIFNPNHKFNMQNEEKKQSVDDLETIKYKFDYNSKLTKTTKPDYWLGGPLNDQLLDDITYDQGQDINDSLELYYKKKQNKNKQDVKSIAAQAVNQQPDKPMYMSDYINQQNQINTQSHDEKWKDYLNILKTKNKHHLKSSTDQSQKSNEQLDKYLVKIPKLGDLESKNIKKVSQATYKINKTKTFNKSQISQSNEDKNDSYDSESDQSEDDSNHQYDVSESKIKSLLHNSANANPAPNDNHILKQLQIEDEEDKILMKEKLNLINQTKQELQSIQYKLDELINHKFVNTTQDLKQTSQIQIAANTQNVESKKSLKQINIKHAYLKSKQQSKQKNNLKNISDNDNDDDFVTESEHTYHSSSSSSSQKNKQSKLKVSQSFTKSKDEFQKNKVKKQTKVNNKSCDGLESDKEDSDISQNKNTQYFEDQLSHLEKLSDTHSVYQQKFKQTKIAELKFRIRDLTKKIDNYVENDTLLISNKQLLITRRDNYVLKLKKMMEEMDKGDFEYKYDQELQGFLDYDINEFQQNSDINNPKEIKKFHKSKFILTTPMNIMDPVKPSQKFPKYPNSSYYKHSIFLPQSQSEGNSEVESDQNDKIEENKNNYNTSNPYGILQSIILQAKALQTQSKEQAPEHAKLIDSLQNKQSSLKQQEKPKNSKLKAKQYSLDSDQYYHDSNSYSDHFNENNSNESDDYDLHDSSSSSSDKSSEDHKFKVDDSYTHSNKKKKKKQLKKQNKVDSNSENEWTDQDDDKSSDSNQEWGSHQTKSNGSSDKSHSSQSSSSHESSSTNSIKSKHNKTSSDSKESSKDEKEQDDEQEDYDYELDDSDENYGEESGLSDGNEISQQLNNNNNINLLGQEQIIENHERDTGQMDSEIPENLARDVIKTYKIVQAAVSKFLKPIKTENFIENALNLPLPESYKALLMDLRFDKMDMQDPGDSTGTNFKHHYNTIAQQNQNPPSSKLVRLAQELADLSNALPYEHTNGIFVRVDNQRVDMMKALICGASSTPYAHGCYEYDIFCDNNYPREPPKMNLITTGNGSVRFNPNLYACGKVCLSLLGTWRGSATENWDPKLSTILQVVLSTQAIIMSEEVYFNEPGFENEAGTPEGEKKNEGYQNIVRYCNIKFAMIEQIKRPSKGFESVIKRHFYIKKSEIMKEVNQWVAFAENNEATYGGLVNDHNYTWANQFKATKTKYKEMLVAAVQQLEDELNKLERPTDYELKLQNDLKKRQQQAQNKNKKKRQGIAEGKEDLDHINVDYEDEEEKDAEDKKQGVESEQINTDTLGNIDVDDEKVKDRWSRYIGAMGVEAVAKQANANIFLSGAGALGIEIAKNLVLSGCKSFTLHDNKAISLRDLSGQFFINYEEDVLNEKKKKNTRGEACMPRLKQLNHYVKCQLAPPTQIPLNIEELEKAPWNFHLMDVIILTEATYYEILFVNTYCRSKGKKFISADSYGVFTRVFNDFGDSFEVLDPNGEELQDVMIKSITTEEEGLVELLPNTKHKLQDGDEIVFSGIEGMLLLEGEKHEEPFEKCLSINDTIHKVKVLTPYAFKIGDTRKYQKYERNGIAKQLKTKKLIQFKSFEESMIKENGGSIPQDENLQYADFEKIQNNIITHIAFEALDLFKKSNNGHMPAPWNRKDADKLIEQALVVAKRFPDLKSEEWKLEDSLELKQLYLFSFTCTGVFNPLCAFMGGFVAQECVKAITQKFTPTNQVFYYDALEVLPDFDPKIHFQPAEVSSFEEQGGDYVQVATENYFEEVFVKEIAKTLEIGHRSDGLRIIVGGDLIDKLAHTKLFMVGAGAIGCELLKNYAMLGVGAGKANPIKKLQAGSIVLTDPDVIEVSNLNRQFLFREKHLRNPKSSTAAAAAIYMNKELRNNIIARLDKVHEGTSHIYTDQFFEDLTVVTNALDNVHARRYIDTRCVTAKTALLESGTLGPKGHVQVILPFLTESYGSSNDPDDNGGEIPHCTLKMFPEETLHCVEWARDKFGKIFTQNIQNTLKILEEGKAFQPVSQQDTMSLRESIKIMEKRPSNFQECVEYARHKFEKFFNHDIRQLLHVYPLDAKTKDGNLFWSLPKRPPVPMEFDPKNPLHCLFVTSFACLRAHNFKIPIPNNQPRTEQFRQIVGLSASEIKVPDFVPNDEKAKEIQASVQKEASEEKKESEENKETLDDKIDPNDAEALVQRFRSLIEKLTKSTEDKLITSELLEPELFEKDNDANFHIDFIYSMANCRSTNYKLDQMDWITVKLKAGRIVPALSTTTSCVAGLQTLELVKLLKGCKKADHRNIFMNMAVPFMQASEPADVMKTKLTDKIEVNLWTRWDVKLGKDVTLKQVIEQIEKEYDGLEVRDVLKGNTAIYFYALMNATGKENEREKVLNTRVQELVGAEEGEDKYVDISVTCVKKKVAQQFVDQSEQIDASLKIEEGEDQSDQILSGVPPVRIHFE